MTFNILTSNVENPTKSKDGKANVGNVHIQILIYLNGPDLDSSLMELT